MRDLNYERIRNGFGRLFAFGIFFSTMIYPNLEYTGYQSAHTCTGECYEEYVRTHGSVVEQLRQNNLGMLETHSHLLNHCGWMCICHGQEGQGIATFPRLQVRVQIIL